MMKVRPDNSVIASIDPLVISGEYQSVVSGALLTMMFQQN
jgi:hypothetical protein